MSVCCNQLMYRKTVQQYKQFNYDKAVKSTQVGVEGEPTYYYYHVLILRSHFTRSEAACQPEVGDEVPQQIKSVQVL